MINNKVCPQSILKTWEWLKSLVYDSGDKLDKSHKNGFMVQFRQKAANESGKTDVNDLSK